MGEDEVLPRKFTRIKLFRDFGRGIENVLAGEVNKWIEENAIVPLSIELKLQSSLGDLYAVIMVTYEEIVPAK